MSAAGSDPTGAAGSQPLAGLSVVEVAVGVSLVGHGLSAGGPGMVLADLGASVTRFEGTRQPEIDDHVEWGRVWHRDKHVVVTDDPAEVRAALEAADVALVYGSEELVEGRGLGWADVGAANPTLCYVRCRPSRTAAGDLGEHALLVEAATGLCSQLEGHRPGPIFLEARAAASGTALVMGASALALLAHRAATGVGGWAETSLYDGMIATLGCMIGRSERAAPEIEGYWTHGSTFPNFLYRCADDELIQVWFGGKGMYPKLLEVLGDEPSEEGYYQDQMTGMLRVRAQRWKELFVRQPRAAWVEQLRAVGVACEPVFGPGEALAEPHLRETGLSVVRTDAGHDDLMLGTPITVRSTFAEPAGSDLGVVGGVASDPGFAEPAGSDLGVADPRASTVTGVLDGVRVLDFSAFVAGPLGAQVLGDLGAEVIKVEPPQGEAMRAAAYAMAAGQRGKRSLAMDIGAPEARPVVEALIGWADVVLHNFRVGVDARLGIDAATVHALNPRAVFCHASAFGPGGPRAKFPGNDALMQAVTGFERVIGGQGNDPIAGTWIPIDMTGGWMAGGAMLAGLFAARATGQGQVVDSSLLGAGMLLQSGVFWRDGQLVRGPELDHDQTGYGPGYRIHRAADDRWLALVVADADTWTRLRALPGLEELPETYAPLRGGELDAVATEAERVLETALSSAPASEWVERLRAAGAEAALVEVPNRDEFRRGLLDDPVNRLLGRAVSFEVAPWGHFEQIGPLLRAGPEASSHARLSLPEVGEHSREVLADLGFTDAQVQALVDAKVVHAP